MFVTGSHRFAAPPEAVWAALTDLGTLRAAALGAGCDHAEASADGEFTASLTASNLTASNLTASNLTASNLTAPNLTAPSLVSPDLAASGPGASQSTLSGHARPAEMLPHQRIGLDFQVTGDLGSLDGRLTAVFDPVEAGPGVETLLRYELRVSLGGGLARAGSYRSENAAKALGARFCIALDDLLATRPLAAVPNTALPPENTPSGANTPADAAAIGDMTESRAPVTVSPTGGGELALTPEASRSPTRDARGIPVGRAGLSPWLWIPLLLILVGLLMVYFR